MVRYGGLAQRLNFGLLPINLRTAVMGKGSIRKLLEYFAKSAQGVTVASVGTPIVHHQRPPV